MSSYLLPLWLHASTIRVSQALLLYVQNMYCTIYFDDRWLGFYISGRESNQSTSSGLPLGLEDGEEEVCGPKSTINTFEEGQQSKRGLWPVFAQFALLNFAFITVCSIVGGEGRGRLLADPKPLIRIVCKQGGERVLLANMKVPPCLPSQINQSCARAKYHNFLFFLKRFL